MHIVRLYADLVQKSSTYGQSLCYNVVKTYYALLLYMYVKNVFGGKKRLKTKSTFLFGRPLKRINEKKKREDFGGVWHTIEQFKTQSTLMTRPCNKCVYTRGRRSGAAVAVEAAGVYTRHVVKPLRGADALSQLPPPPPPPSTDAKYTHHYVYVCTECVRVHVRVSNTCIIIMRLLYRRKKKTYIYMYKQHTIFIIFAHCS